MVYQQFVNYPSFTVYENIASRPKAHTIRFDAVGVTFDRSGRPVDVEHILAAF